MENKEIREACYHIIDALWVTENIEKLPTCNNCKCKNECKYVPKPGEMLRVNCFAHEWNEESLAKMMPEGNVNEG